MKKALSIKRIIKSFGYAINGIRETFLNEPNMKLNELNRIKIPVVVLAGEKDIIKYKHSKLIADNIPNSILEIVNKENHGSYIIHSDKIYEIIKKYL